jgi:oligosaccharide reducing-end xylanase
MERSVVGKNGNSVRVLDVLKLSHERTLGTTANALPSIDKQEVFSARPKESKRNREKSEGIPMKRVLTWLVPIILLVLLSSTSFASHEIMRWRDNRAGAVSVTFDDGYVSQYTTGAHLLNARNFKGTFFLVADVDFLGSLEAWQNIAEQGHEIGSHTVSHPALTQLSETELREELSQSQEAINLNIPTQSCLTLAYPYGYYDEFVQEITSEYYIAGRGVWPPLNHYPGGSYDPVDFFAIGSFSFDYPSLTTFEELENYLDSAEEHNAWFVPHIHVIEGPEYLEVLSQFLDELLARDIWVDTLGTIVRYMREKMSSTLTIISESDSEITLSLTHSLDNSIYNVPLTIRSAVPSSWSEVEIRQGGSVYVIEPAIENGSPAVYYNAIPNAGLITLAPTSAPTCYQDEDCDDGNDCTVDTCVDGQCVNECNATSPDDSCCGDPACVDAPACICGPQLDNGMPCSGTITAAQEDHYYIDVPEGQASLEVELIGSDPDADIYVRYGAPPTTSDYDCRPYTSGSNESCSESNPTSGTWYIMVRGYSGTVDYEIVAEFTP